MKNTFFLVLMIVVSIGTHAQKISKDLILGVWKSEEYKIEIFKSGDTYSAKLLWSKDMFEADGKTYKKDDKNPDIKLRTRPRQGITHITGLKFKDGEFIEGKLYSANDGNTYGFKGKLTDVNNLETRAYKGLPIMGKTVNWTRVK